MHVVLISEDDNPDAWRKALAGPLPEVVLHAWPDVPPQAKAQASVALTWKPPPGALAQFPKLRLIQNLGMGVDGLFLDPDLPPAVPIARMVDPDLIVQMSEYVCWAVLNCHRQFDRYLAQQRERRWLAHAPPDTKACTVGILGLGEIGSDCAAKLAALGFPVLGWSRRRKTLDSVESFAGVGELAPFLRRCRVVVCLLPLTDATRGIINAERLALLPPNAYVVNVARGGHVDDRALLAALDSGRLAGATLDVTSTEPLPPDHPYWTHPKVRLTPHIAGLTRPEVTVTQVAENIRRVIDGERPLYQVERGRGY